MKKVRSVMFLLMSALVFFAADVQASSSMPAGAATAANKPNWQAEWSDALAKGKKEGVVTLSTTWKPEMRQAVSKAFTEKYGIKLEFMMSGRGSEAVAKIQAERRAGLNLQDFFAGGSTTATNLLKPAGLLGSMEQLLILPEAIDPKAWRGGKLPFQDKQKQFLALIAQKKINIIYNTDLIKKGEITTYEDVLKNQYKGRIVMNDPSLTGSGNSMLTHLSYEIWDVERAKEYLKRLLKEQRVVLERDNRLAVETVARGKYAICLGPDQQNTADFIRMGAPVDGVLIKEPTSVAAGSGGISAAIKQPHPNAAKIFLNWLLTREGITALSRSAGVMSMRNDATVEGIHPLWIFQPGEELRFQTDEKDLALGVMMKVAKQVIDESRR